MVNIGNDWDELLAGEWDKPYYLELRSFLKEEYASGTVYPPAADVFNALRMTPYNEVKAVILGQDPYHEPGQAQGLAFSVPYDVPQPPSLVNIIKELADDIGPEAASTRFDAIGTGSGATITGSEAAGMSGVLVPWTRQGVLLLNTSLTVRAHQAGSHRGKGWEQFTDKVIELLASREKPMVFILWGAHAGAKRDLIIRAQQRPTPGTPAPAAFNSAAAPGLTGDFARTLRHLIIQAPHPSPLSAYRGFFGGRYFSRTNYFLEDNDIEPIDWRL